MLASAQERKAELLRVQERKIQREREEEKALYGEIDTEKFVTSGYKKQMEEQRAVEAAERKKEGVSRKKVDLFLMMTDSTSICRTGGRDQEKGLDRFLQKCLGLDNTNSPITRRTRQKARLRLYLSKSL